MPIKFDTVNRQRSTIYKSVDEHMDTTRTNKSRLVNYQLDIIEGESKSVTIFKINFNRKLATYLELHSLAADYSLIISMGDLENQYKEFVINGLRNQRKYLGKSDSDIWEDVATAGDVIVLQILKELTTRLTEDWIIFFGKLEILKHQKRSLIKQFYADTQKKAVTKITNFKIN